MANARHSKASRFVQQRLFCDLSDFAELERRIAALPDEKSCGDAFEVFAEAYLATQRKYDAAQVWPHGSVPLDILKNLGLSQQDQGVDGVLQTLLGQFNAYQIKFRTGRPSLTWRELSTFIGLAGSPQIHSRVLLTNCDELPAVLNDRQGFFCIRGADLDRLEADEFRAIEAWLADAAYTAPKKSPKKHQIEALDALLPALQTHDRVSAIMACGTGKTLVALWVTERLEARRVLVLLPSLALLRQTLHEWLRETSLPSLAYLCVCSDPTVTEGLDTLATQQSDLDFEVSTDAASVRSFLDAPFAGVKMIFSTYQSASVVGTAMQPGEAFDFAVFDEAHKTAGREGRNFAFALDDKNISIRKRLFMTATPRHYNPLGKDKEGVAQLVFSMDEPLVYGKQAFRLNFAEAARRDIICNYKVVISVITSTMVTNDLLSRGEVLVNGDPIRARQVANQIALTDAIAKNGVNKVFTFHGTVKSAASFVTDGSEGVRTHLPKFETFHVNGAMPTARRERIMQCFRAASLAVMSNARCLTEGVDVPAVDMVAFLSPKRSLVDIVQATGRAMRKSPETGKKLGYVLVPLYVEQARGESIEEAVMRSDFDEVWNVLNRLQEHDDVLAQIISEMRIERGKTGGFDDSRFRERVAMLGPSVSLDSLRQSITAACLDAIGDGWFERYGQLVAYQKKHGNRDLPARWPENQKLATWVVNQRVLQRDGVLEQEKIELLNRIGFKWNPKVSLWRTNYLALLDYRNRFGNCRVPQKWVENKKLATWVSSQRALYVRNKLSRERSAMLDKIGFEWSTGVATWDERFAELCGYKDRFGNTLVPIKWAENLLLGRWVGGQRYKRTRGDMRKEHEDRLNAIGFEWKAPSILLPAKSLKTRIETLLAYKTEHGHLAVSHRDKKYPGLANWMSEQRKQYRTGTIPPEFKKQLDEIEFPWKPAPPNTDKQWFEMFARFKNYASVNGTTTVRIVDEITAKLNGWMLQQRSVRKKGGLSDVRIQALDGIGFIWQRNKRKSETKLPPDVHKVSSRTWSEMFSELSDFFKLQGHCNVPADWQAHPELARWVYHQRIAKRQNRLTTDQVRQMEEIGFAWSTNDGDWDTMFAKLVEHLRPMHNGKPRERVVDAQLRSWIITQRQFKKHGELAAERERKLNSIGFEWSPFSKQWEQLFDMLRQFHFDHGHCRVPAKWAKNPKLASWVAVQRARKPAGKLSTERIAALDGLGFSWSGRSSSGKAWESMFAALKQFCQENGHTNVPQKYVTNRKLGWWVSIQRRDRRKGKLDSKQIAQLDGIGFNWSPQSGGTSPDDEGWKAMLASLQQFKNEYGHCRVPAQWSINPKLANWVATQRRFKKHGELKAERVAALDGIGFEWILERGSVVPPLNQRGNMLTAAQAWDAMFLKLQEYNHVNGNCLVPQGWKGNRKLADWVSEQRVANNKGRLDAERCRRLEGLGFDWDPNNNHWEKYFHQLVEFKQEYGHTNVPQRSGRYAALGTWVRNQRAAKRYKRPIMAERAKRLAELGFVWMLVEPMGWERAFAALVEFKKVHGHCNVPQKSGEHKRLGKWVNTQRTQHYRGKLRADRKQLLDSIGFVWNLRPNLASAR